MKSILSWKKSIIIAISAAFLTGCEGTTSSVSVGYGVYGGYGYPYYGSGYYGGGYYRPGRPDRPNRPERPIERPDRPTTLPSPSRPSAGRPSTRPSSSMRSMGRPSGGGMRRR